MLSSSHGAPGAALTRAAVTLALTAAVAGAATPAWAAPRPAQIDVTSACRSVSVTSTKDLSNVVVMATDGTIRRFEGLTGRSGAFSLGESVLATVWVKSGSNASGDGPGYGQRFDLDTTACAAAAPPPSPAPVGPGAGGSAGVPTAPSPGASDTENGAATGTPITDDQGPGTPHTDDQGPGAPAVGDDDTDERDADEQDTGTPAPDVTPDPATAPDTITSDEPDAAGEGSQGGHAATGAVPHVAPEEVVCDIEGRTGRDGSSDAAPTGATTDDATDTGRTVVALVGTTVGGASTSSSAGAQVTSPTVVVDHSTARGATDATVTTAQLVGTAAPASPAPTAVVAGVEALASTGAEIPVLVLVAIGLVVLGAVALRRSARLG